MLKRTHKVALMAVLTVVMVLAFAGVALAQWTDISLSVVGPYGITEAQLGQISQGYSDGSWGPYNLMPRKQFVKMAVDAYKIPLVSPATPTYTDVPTTDYYYPYIEGATAAGLTNGVGGGLFNPNGTITREQAAAIIVRWVADKNGYDLDTYYTDAEAAAIIAAFPDAAQVGPSLIKEVAFAIDFGIIWGTNTGNLAPKGDVIRIQGAALLIRSWGVLPFIPPLNPPANIELVSTDKAENLIGEPHTATFKVTDAAGAPVAWALVDFDTVMGPYYMVGNISPAAGLTDENGEVECLLWSQEPGTEVMTATVKTPTGLKVDTMTKYWLVLDEVYILDPTQIAQNNAGDEHQWAARVVVFGPGPLSTSPQDWYNAIDTAAVPGPAMEDDGIDVGGGWDFADENALAAEGYVPRTMAGIPVTWSIIDEEDSEGVIIPSVGEIVAVEFLGTIGTDGQFATAFTDEYGYTTVTINSIETGQTLVQVIADYADNPYPQKLFTHWTFEEPEHNEDWQDQQDRWEQIAFKTWIPHVIGDDTSPISPALTYVNLGEETLLTITLKDSFGNPVADRQVEWFMQGVGFFVTDDGNEITDPEDPAGNKDLDVTDAAGQAFVLVKSYDAGEQIVHAKVRDKGTGGNEGSYITYDAEVQWFDVDVVTFDDPVSDEDATVAIERYQHVGDDGPWYAESWVAYDYDDGAIIPWTTNEALASNDVGTDHTFTLHVYGLKLELDPNVDNADQQTPLIDTDYKGAAYDGVIDWRDASYFGSFAVLFINCNQHPESIPGYLGGADINGNGMNMPFDYNGNGVIDNGWVEAYDFYDAEWPGNKHHDEYWEPGTALFLVQGREIMLTGVGGVTRYDWNEDGFKEAFDGMTGIYLPLEGKTVTFDMADEDGEDLSDLGAWFEQNLDVDAVGSIVSPDVALTDINGEAEVTVTSDVKGPQTIEATVDWEGNPHADASQLVKAYAKKLWIADAGIKIEVVEDGDVIATDEDGQFLTKTIPWYTWDEDLAGWVLNTSHYEVHVYDQFGNDLPDYEVVYLLSDLGEYQNGNQWAGDTYRPIAFLQDADPFNILATPFEDELGDTIYAPYDQNGTEPDSDEPTPESDPYAPIVGDGGTHAFFFNQWLGAGIAGTYTANKNVEAGIGVYSDIYDQDASVPGYVQWPGQRENGQQYFTEYTDEHGKGLVTDGAKAWTLDGYFMPDNWEDVDASTGPEYEPGDIVPNLLTGSNIDVTLAEDATTDPTEPSWVPDADDYLTILHIMVYAPADGLVVGQEPELVWSYQIHQMWEDIDRVPTTLTLEQSTDDVDWTADDLLIGIPLTGYCVVNFRGQVLDQFGDPMPNENFEAWTPKIGWESSLPGNSAVYDLVWYYGQRGWPLLETDDEGYIYGTFTLTQEEVQTAIILGWLYPDGPTEDPIISNAIEDEFVLHYQ